VRVFLGFCIVIVFVILITSCTSSHVYVSTGDGARAGKRNQVETQMDAELNTSVVGLGKSKIVNPK